MSAGRIPVPKIIPLGIEENGNLRNHINRSTPIEIRCGKYEYQPLLSENTPDDSFRLHLATHDSLHGRR
jgi:hypothetical protein